MSEYIHGWYSYSCETCKEEPANHPCYHDHDTYIPDNM